MLCWCVVNSFVFASRHARLAPASLGRFRVARSLPHSGEWCARVHIASPPLESCVCGEAAMGQSWCILLLCCVCCVGWCELGCLALVCTGCACGVVCFGGGRGGRSCVLCFWAAGGCVCGAGVELSSREARTGRRSRGCLGPFVGARLVRGVACGRRWLAGAREGAERAARARTIFPRSAVLLSFRLQEAEEHRPLQRRRSCRPTAASGSGDESPTATRTRRSSST